MRILPRNHYLQWCWCGYKVAWSSSNCITITVTIQALSDWSIYPFLDNRWLQIFLELCSLALWLISTCNSSLLSFVAKLAHLPALFLAHCIKSALIFVQLSAFCALVLFHCGYFLRDWVAKCRSHCFHHITVHKLYESYSNNISTHSYIHIFAYTVTTIWNK